MFLYPLARMTGGVYYEHAHRLYGTLVGLTTIVLTIHLFRADSRRWLKVLAVVAVLMVIIQGTLGGFRVSEAALEDGVEVSTPGHESVWSLRLAVVHGVFGQVFFSVLVAIAVFTSRTWRTAGSPTCRASASSDRLASGLLVILIIAQLVFGAVQRHFNKGLLIHITLAVIVVTLAVACGVLAWGRNPGQPTLLRWGKLLTAWTLVQLMLGMGALIGIGIYGQVKPPPTAEVLLTTAHQAVGAVLLACAVVLLLWNYRLLSPHSTASVPTGQPQHTQSPPAVGVR
jgi:cytochrome c oxidase assembly protein subunit 15